ncbi:MAG: HAD family hydrolase [Terrimesophilobacter sp.]
MSAVDLVIFDCDGVLVDSEVVAVRVMQRILADVGWVISIDEIVERFVGGSKDNFTAQVSEYLQRPLAPDWSAQYSPWYDEAFQRDLRPVAGIEKAIDALNIPSCVASNSSHNRVRSSLCLTGLLDRFEGRIFSAQDVEHAKPAPDIYLAVARRMDVAPDRCVVVEDSKFGVQAARAAGMSVLGYAGGLTPAAWLEGESTTIFTSMDDLVALIG